eukprot:gene15660-13865_t
MSTSMRITGGEELLGMVDAFVFDCDGVIWRGDHMIERADAMLEMLVKLNKTVVFVTNNSTKTLANFQKKFSKFGIAVEQSQLIATVEYLISKGTAGKKVYVIGEPGLHASLQEAGIATVGEEDAAKVFDDCESCGPDTLEKDIAAVVVGWDKQFNYYKVCKAANLIRYRDCEFISTNQDLMLLAEYNQLHLIEEWDYTELDRIDAFFKQLQVLDSNYPEGLGAYIMNARKLLADSAAGANPLGGFTPEVPTGCTLNFGTDEFIKAEEDGLARGAELAFVLVAGGLGERLGFSSIKIALPTEITTGKRYIEMYIEAILAIQRDAEVRQRKPVEIPLAIMTSGDTHARTVALLEENRNFGMSPTQITLLQQEKVASLNDNNPHGHGDVHYLLHSSGLARKWLDERKQFVVFFQDTNALVF